VCQRCYVNSFGQVGVEDASASADEPIGVPCVAGGPPGADTHLCSAPATPGIAALRPAIPGMAQRPHLPPYEIHHQGAW
jgi:hypothetical protein